MAQRDKSQGFGFIYVDVPTLLKNKDQLALEANAPGKSINFPKDEPKAKKDDTGSAFGEIKSNLDRLQSLHHKLHAVLEELNQLTKKKRS